MVISEFIARINGWFTTPLERAGYMSPVDESFKGTGFACAQCDWKRKDTPLRKIVPGSVTYCAHPKISSFVEERGCCNLYTYKGVHTY